MDRSRPHNQKRSRFDSGSDPTAVSKAPLEPRPAARATATTQSEPIDIEPTLAARRNFSQLLAAGRKANALEKLNNPGPFTIFAPTDEAFRKLPPELLNRLMNDTEALERLLFHHAITAKIDLADALDRGQEKTALGSTLQFRREANVSFVNEAKILEADVMCRNGVVHVVDCVLFPPEMEAELKAPQSVPDPAPEPPAPTAPLTPQPTRP